MLPSFERMLPHLVAMCDGKRHTFFDHELAVAMRTAGYIAYDAGDWVITDQGRQCAVAGMPTHQGRKP